MDKNTIAGLVLIFIILFAASYFNKPSEKEIERLRLKNDSIAMAENVRAREETKKIEFSAVQQNTSKTRILSDYLIQCSLIEAWSSF